MKSRFKEKFNPFLIFCRLCQPMNWPTSQVRKFLARQQFVKPRTVSIADASFVLNSAALFSSLEAAAEGVR